MPPIRNITEIAANIITNGKNIPQDNSIDFDSIIERSLAILGMIFSIFIFTAWISCLVLYVYESMKRWKKHSPTLNETKTNSKPLNVYIVAGDGAKASLVESKNGTKSYGTMSQV
ncbi:hypothetical protein OCU04_007371 [Sclerotinia nivalis]|uniref:Uncharacterized protein n=1 Tax=Sclerotinia nivalis TaxID=352851 RepID=A0A9X0DIC4_9HELO|nr:hypothetical protein OCU04_007371 [Sclerotinia nivalis]